VERNVLQSLRGEFDDKGFHVRDRLSFELWR
jgi:hypothetical protein